MHNFQELLVIESWGQGTTARCIRTHLSQKLPLKAFLQTSGPLLSYAMVKTHSSSLCSTHGLPGGNTISINKQRTFNKHQCPGLMGGEKTFSETIFSLLLKQLLVCTRWNLFSSYTTSWAVDFDLKTHRRWNLYQTNGTHGEKRLSRESWKALKMPGISNDFSLTKEFTSNFSTL